MGLEDLIDELRTLPPADLARVVDFVAHLREREAGEEGALELGAGGGGDALDRIAASPELKARFDAMLDTALAGLDRGEGMDGAAFFARMREKSQRRRAPE